MEKIETQLKRLSPQLSMQESQVLWSRVEQGLTPRGARSPKKGKARRPLFRAVTAGFVILGLLGGSVVTAYASEALPGDSLYTAKITIERVQIALSPQAKKKDLQLAFADRRVKEVAAVLADIEEDSVIGAMDPVGATMALSAPAPEAVSLAFAVPADMESHSEDDEGSMAMKAVALPEDHTSDTEDDSLIPVVAQENRMMMKTSLAFEDANANQQKRWKNIEGKKKAIAIAIKELERTREELRRSGATSTSQNVDAVIVNLTELNSSGTTPDDTFVEKAKNNEIEVIDEEEKERQSRRKNDDDNESKFVDATLPDAPKEILGAGVFLSDVNEDIQKEVEEVRVRNAERRKRGNFEEKRDLMRSESQSSDEARVPVCVDIFGKKEELSVLPSDLSRYIEEGFVEGACPPSTSTTESTES